MTHCAASTLEPSCVEIILKEIILKLSSKQFGHRGLSHPSPSSTPGGPVPAPGGPAPSREVLFLWKDSSFEHCGSGPGVWRRGALSQKQLLTAHRCVTGEWAGWTDKTENVSVHFSCRQSCCLLSSVLFVTFVVYFLLNISCLLNKSESHIQYMNNVWMKCSLCFFSVGLRLRVISR